MDDVDYFNYNRIPEHMMENIQNYINFGEQLGGFLTRVFENDLFEAVAEADKINKGIIPIYVHYIYNNCPIGCHGSREIVESWYIKKRKELEINKNGKRI